MHIVGMEAVERFGRVKKPPKRFNLYFITNHGRSIALQVLRCGGQRVIKASAHKLFAQQMDQGTRKEMESKKKAEYLSLQLQAGDM